MAYKKLKYWFDKDLAISLATKVSQVDDSFNKAAFVKKVATELDDLELKDRIEIFADAFYQYLGKEYKKGLVVLSQILGPENKEETGMFTNYYWIMPIAKYIEKYGLNDFELSMKAIEEITKRNTGEYTIRPFIEEHTDKTMQQMLVWSTNKNFHVRRLACEGIRPRLPWAKKMTIFVQDPTTMLPILENLKDDTSKYVQKSVANCINDILKDNIEVAKELIEKWNKPSSSPQRKWIIKHALRNLRKKEDPWAMKMIAI